MNIDGKKYLGLWTVLCLLGPGLSAQVLTADAQVPLQDMLTGGGEQPAILALPQGGFAIASNQPTSHRTATLRYSFTNAEGDQILQRWEQSHHIPLDLQLALSAEGFFSVALDRADLFLPNRLLASRFDAQNGEEIEIDRQINPEGTFPTAYDITQLAGGDLLAVWNDVQVSPGGPLPIGLFAQRMTPDGQMVGTAAQLSEGSFSQPRLAASGDGRYLVVWIDPDDGAVYAQAFDDSHQGGAPRTVVATEEAASQITLSTLPDGAYLLVWSETDPSDPNAIFGRRIHPSGIPFDEKIEIGPASEAVKASPRVATDRFGRSWVVWAERPLNAPGEVYLRILEADGSPGGLLRLPEVERADQTDPVVAVDPDGVAMVAWVERETGDFDKVQARTVRASSSCPASDTVLCLQGGRFQVEVSWADFGGDSGPGHVIPFQSDDSGIFWFFQDEIWELMVKVIDGCSFNGFYWVFSAATTDVAYEMVVTDTETGLQRTYINELGEAARANTDTAALMSCPLGPP